VNTLLAAQAMMNAKEEGQVTMHGRIKPRPGIGLLARVMHRVDREFAQGMIQRAYFRAAPAVGALREKVESRSSEQQ
jgi:hypothetical protein